MVGEIRHQKKKENFGNCKKVYDSLLLEKIQICHLFHLLLWSFLLWIYILIIHICIHKYSKNIYNTHKNLHPATAMEHLNHKTANQGNLAANILHSTFVSQMGNVCMFVSVSDILAFSLPHTLNKNMPEAKVVLGIVYSPSRFSNAIPVLLHFAYSFLLMMSA